MEWIKGITFALALTLVGTPALAQQSQDPDEGTVQDTLQEPIGETMGMDSEQGQQETAVPSGEERLPGEKTLNQPIEKTLNQPAEDTLEAIVPGGGTEVKGKIKSIDEETGNLTLETQEGQSLDLHADPAMLQGMDLKEDTKVTAKYEKQGEMNHITQLEKESKKDKKKDKEQM